MNDLHAAIRLLTKRNGEAETIRKTKALLAILEELGILIEFKISINDSNMHVSWKYNRKTKGENYTYRLSN